MLLREATGEHQAAGFAGDRFIGKGAPWNERHAPLLHQFTRFGIAEMEGRIRSHCDWVAAGLPGLFHVLYGQRIRAGRWGLQQGKKFAQMEMGLGERGPSVPMRPGVVKFMGWGQTEVTARQREGIGSR